MSTAGGAASELLALALDERSEPAADPVAGRILDAACERAAAVGIERLTMDAVAERAGVGRMTVYRRFQSRDGLARALVLREARRGLSQIAAAIDPAADPADQLAEGFVAMLRVARAQPLLQRVLRFEPQELLAALNDPDDPLLDVLRGFGVLQLAAGIDPGEMRADPEVVAELLVRIGLSFLLVPRGRIEIGDEATARRLAHDLFAPMVSRV